MIEAAMNENQRRLVVLPVVPELQLEAIRVEKVRNWFHGTLRNPMRELVHKIHGIPMVRQHYGTGVAVRPERCNISAMPSVLATAVDACGNRWYIAIHCEEPVATGSVPSGSAMIDSTRSFTQIMRKRKQA
jgi:hypothetical protein